MEDKKVELSDLKRKHFAKLHEKIQSKYDEMQKKLAKSKSVDMITSVHDDFEFNEESRSSLNDLRMAEYEIENEPVTLTTEEVIIKSVCFQDVEREARITEHVEDFMFIERNELYDDVHQSDNLITDNHFSNEFSHMSLESLNETGAESDEVSSVPTSPTVPTSKLSIRNRISSRIIAAKEKRLQKERIKEKKKEPREKVEKFILSNTTKHSGTKIYKRNKVATVTIALIEATGLETNSLEDKHRLYSCRFRLGTEKHKSKVVKIHDAVAKWQELFNLNMYDDDMLELTLWEKETLLGRSVILLTEVEKEKTHKLRIKLECHAEVFILLTVTGTALVNTLVDLDDYEKTQRRLSKLEKDFVWYHIKNKNGDVGWLSVIVYGAKGLSGHDCYCVLELANNRLQTHTEAKTSDPNWMKIFSFAVQDITSILDITVYDEKKSEIVGKLSISLLDIKNGEKKWYALKDAALRDRARGHNPRILIEMKLTWNLLRASLRVINPKEEKYLETEDKLQRHIFARNLSRAKAVLAWIMDAFRVVKTLFEWESRKSNLIALTLWLLFCWFFKIWMLPLLLLLPFLWYTPQNYFLINWRKKETTLDIYEDSKKDKEEKNTSLRQKINSLQEMVQTVQNFIGKFASLGESIKNLFNFTVPFLSFLAICVISVVALVMFLIPVKYIFMFWGIHKFTRKILRPNRIPNNEILDLLSRVPDDETLLDIKQLPLEDVPAEDVIQ